MSASTRVLGDAELARKLTEAKDAAKVVLEAAALAGAEVVRKAAVVRAPGPGIVMVIAARRKTFAEAAVGPEKKKWYYRLLESGVKAHEIEVRRAPVLVFEGLGGKVRTPLVHHPGFSPRPFLRPALDENEDGVVREMGEEFKAAIMEVA